MSMALGHFAFGAAMTTLVITFLIPTVGYPRMLIFAGGGWAMLPDLHWVSPFATEQLQQLHHASVWMDLFWLHRTWDRIDPTDSKSIAAGLFAFLIIVTAIAERREYRTPAFVKSVYEPYLEPE